MATESEISLLLLYAIFFTARANFDPYSDNNRFMMHFPGDLPQHQNDGTLSPSDYLQDEDSMVIVTRDNEKYKCLIPHIAGSADDKTSEGSTYEGLSEMELLSPLFQQSSCSYKIEPYWTYELCHGRFIRQYHEEREEKDTKIQEYILGNYKEKEATTEGDEESLVKRPAGVKQVGGKDLPYFAVEYHGGTHCELTSEPRHTTVLYICHELGRGEIYDLKEISSCHYEVTILTQMLCSHPHYTARKDQLNIINCHAMDKSARRPTSLVNFELENAQARYNRPEDQIYPKSEAHKTSQKTAEAPPSSKKSTPRHRAPEATPKGDSAGLTQTDRQLLRDFLSGDYCIQGGSGWWKHEFCYGKRVTQYHEEQTGDRTTIVLGMWDEDEHNTWIKKKKVPTATLR